MNGGNLIQAINTWAVSLVRYARLDVHCRGFSKRQRAAFFDIRVCHPNADSYKELTPTQIYQLHENEKKRKYGFRVTEVEQGTFTPLVFTT